VKRYGRRHGGWGVTAVSDTLTVIEGGARTKPRLRLAELVAALSLGIDLGFGQPMEHVLRQCLIALRLGELIELSEQERLDVYYTALLVNVGCHTDAHEQAKWFGDDIATKAAKYDVDMRSISGMVNGMRMLGSGSAPLHRFRIGMEFFLYGHKDVDGMVESHSRLARALASELGLPAAVQDSVGTAYERWDGRGWPGELKGSRIPLASRVAQMAEFIEVAHRVGGLDAATKLATERAGTQFDPQLCRVLVDHSDSVLGMLDDCQTWDAVIAAEPSLMLTLTQEQAEAALIGVADFVDLKSPYTLGHARAAADLATATATSLALSPAECALTRHAVIVHGFGRLGVSNAIWDKPGPLAAGERERVRMHPYFTERMLSQSQWLAPLGVVAVQLRERLDGSGYPRGVDGSRISMPARILAAADVYQSMIEPRPYRSARSPGEAAQQLRAEVSANRLDGDAVEGVLAAAGHAAMRRREHPAGLTSREIDVLRLLARGLSSRQISERLVIAPKTARNHIEYIYTKIGATSRVTASMFAVKNGLLPESTYVAEDA
jgi:HD-GYP domain-containing protein (c-di-GMP phosphodiesterase class II)